ncbi:HEAT repeat domain-containing protein [Lysobacter enzymogenes]|uniref:HEAT repeat domain-containing protein n=1 Tax=Lysobacter enzymogenes TaxID=69 RepID=A0A3N2RKZ9_LYSEN|nr:HEAT repeat domain-containing protein [Lysobacter enzymogenes]ROU08079.1 hypothetical protein D9T17_05855 [Lysobacter enzymogenes]
MNFKQVLPIAVVSAAIGALAGGAYVRHRDRVELAPALAAPRADAAAAPARDDAGGHGSGEAGSPYPRYLALGSGAPASFEALRKRAASDPAFLQDLLQRFRNDPQPDARGELLALLQAVGGEDVLRYALSLAASTRGQDERAGLDLLGGYSLERAEVREALLAKLRAGGDAQREVELIRLLTPAAVPDEDAAPVAAQLATLARDPDPEVRAEAVFQLAQWAEPAQAEDALHRALLDPAAAVRSKAINAVAGSHARSERLKDALLAIAADPASAPGDRGAAALALQDFRLSRAEYALWKRAQARADADSGEGG